MGGGLLTTEEDGSAGAEVWSDSSGLAGVKPGPNCGYDGGASASGPPWSWSGYVESA